MSRARDLASIFNLSPLSGTTAERPSTATIGQLYYNGTTAKTQIYTSTGWQDMASGIAYGNNSGRPANPTLGTPYFNGEAGRLELYTANGWSNIVQEVPGISSVAATLGAVGSATLQIVGTNFSTGAIASVIGTNGVEVQASSTTVNSLVSVTASFNGLSYLNDPYDVKVTNPSNLFGLIADAFSVNQSPIWQTASGSLGTFNEQVSITLSALSASDPESTSITYSVASGSSLPSGLSLNSSTGVISGTLPALSTDTTYTFTINATDGVNTIPRSFSITSRDIFTVEYLIAGGGGAGGDYLSGDGYNAAGGGGGAGGLLISTASITSGTQVPIVVGLAGVSTATSNTSGGLASNGQNSSFNNIIAYGGGRGGAGNSSMVNAYVAGSGGSGGGGVRPDGAPSYATAGSGTSGQGNNGGSYVSGDGDGGGGGGASGTGASGGSGSQGGSGTASSITGTSTYYCAGGGGGKGQTGSWVSNNAGTGGGGVGGAKQNSSVGGNASTYGSGGGGAGSAVNASSPFAKGGNGGNGVVVIAYPDTKPALATIPGTLTYDQPTRSGYRVYRFTAGTGTVTF
jgi:hypothetical protein